MREILFKAKRIDNGEWVEGHYYSQVYHKGTIEEEWYHFIKPLGSGSWEEVVINADTLCQYTGLTDKNGKKIWEGDVVEYNTFDDFNCYSVVKIGEYKQDGSCGEYSPRDCIGIYVEVDNFTCPDWAEDDPSCFLDYLEIQNLLEVWSDCEVIGNIFDNPELLKGE